MIRITAMTPATIMAATSTSTNRPGPRKAPNAPMSFQSPPPKARKATNGNNTSKPSAAPSREAFAPGHPAAITFAPSPVISPLSVSQFGMRR